MGSFSTLPLASLWILGAQQLGKLSVLTSASAANLPLVQLFLLLLSIEKKWLLGHFLVFQRIESHFGHSSFPSLAFILLLFYS